MQITHEQKRKQLKKPVAMYPKVCYNYYIESDNH
jgi:hypothetical protein